MLVLSRKRGQGLVLLGLGELAVRLRVLSFKGAEAAVCCPSCAASFVPPPVDATVRLGIEASPSVHILREEMPHAPAAAAAHPPFVTKVVM